MSKFANCFATANELRNYDLPDVERDYFKLNYTGRIISDGASSKPEVNMEISNE